MALGEGPRLRLASNVDLPGNRAPTANHTVISLMTSSLEPDLLGSLVHDGADRHEPQRQLCPASILSAKPQLRSQSRRRKAGLIEVDFGRNLPMPLVGPRPSSRIVLGTVRTRRVPATLSHGDPDRRPRDLGASALGGMSIAAQWLTQRRSNISLAARWRFGEESTPPKPFHMAILTAFAPTQRGL